MSWNGNEHNVLLRNEGVSADGIPAFADVGMASATDDISDARGMAFADFDNDGDLDIIVNNNPGDCGKESVAPVLLKNNVGQSRNWLVLHLEGSESNRDALGAEVRVYSAEFRALRHVHAGAGYASQGDPRLYFGLGTKDVIERISVKWPTGRIQEFSNVNANQILFLKEAMDLTSAPYEVSNGVNVSELNPTESPVR